MASLLDLAREYLRSRAALSSGFRPEDLLQQLMQSASATKADAAFLPLIEEALTSGDIARAAALGLSGSELDLAQQQRRRASLVDLVRQIRQLETGRALEQQRLGLSAAGALLERELAERQLREERRRNNLGFIASLASMAARLVLPGH